MTMIHVYIMLNEFPCLIVILNQRRCLGAFQGHSAVAEHHCGFADTGGAQTPQTAPAHPPRLLHWL